LLLKKRFKDLTQDEVRTATYYEDGSLFWKIHKGTCKIGEECGSDTLVGNGYRYMCFSGVKASVHRFIWLYHNGQYDGDLDHTNGVLTDNRIENLRIVTRSQNLLNRSKFKNCSSKLKGTYWRKDVKKWQAGIRLNGKTKSLGLYETEEAAHNAWCKAAKEVHGEFFRCN
jgi:hypothetical protein